jgi:hypothetical protein
MVEALQAEGPVGPDADTLLQFGRFVGTWDLDVTYYEADGSIRRRTPGEWLFGWVLEGRAIQDVWITPPRSLRTAAWPPAGEYGTSLRFYDDTIGAWRSTWLGPVNGVVWPFIARQVGADMVLERRDDEGAIVRWSFLEIRPDAFSWRATSSRDEGRTWRLDQQMLATRRKP